MYTGKSNANLINAKKTLLRAAVGTANYQHELWQCMSVWQIWQYVKKWQCCTEPICTKSAGRKFLKFPFEASTCMIWIIYTGSIKNCAVMYTEVLQLQHWF
jgi:hypothetical protein